MACHEIAEPIEDEMEALLHRAASKGQAVLSYQE